MFDLEPAIPHIIRAEIVETAIPDVSIGQEAEIVSEADPTKVSVGRVLRVAATFGARKLKSDSGTEATDERVVEVVVSAENAPYLIGQRVLVKFMKGGEYAAGWAPGPPCPSPCETLRSTRVAQFRAAGTDRRRVDTICPAPILRSVSRKGLTHISTTASLRFRKLLGGLLLASLWSAIGAAPPKAGAGDDDPFLWLEDLSGDRAMTWVKAENAKTLGVLEKDAKATIPRH